MKTGLSISGAAVCELNECYVCHTTFTFNVHALVTSLLSPFDSESGFCASHVSSWECIDAFQRQPGKQLNREREKERNTHWFPPMVIIRSFLLCTIPVKVNHPFTITKVLIFLTR